MVYLPRWGTWITPPNGNDDARERNFLNRLSGESRFLRFQQWVNAPSDKLIHFLTDIDYDKHMAFVCTVPSGAAEELVGEASYGTNPDGNSCEFSVVIADSWRNTGIAGLLMEALIRAARERGLASMEGLVLSHNATMLRFARGLGFEICPNPGDPTTKRIVKKL